MGFDAEFEVCILVNAKKINAGDDIVVQTNEAINNSKDAIQYFTKVPADVFVTVKQNKPKK